MTGWRVDGRAAHHRVVQQTPRRIAVVALVLGSIAFGASACGGGDTQGRKEPDLNDVESQVAQLRLEVQTLRQEVRSLQESVVPTTTGIEALPLEPTATTTTPPTTDARG